MKQLISASLGFLTKPEKYAFICFVAGRALASLLDLVGVVAIGYLAASIALFVNKGSDSSRKLEVYGNSIPTANIQALPLIVLAIVLVLVGKAALSLYLTRRQVKFLAKVEARAARTIAERLLGSHLEDAGKLSREELFYAATAGASAAFTGLLTAFTTLVAEGTLFVLLLGTFFIVDWASTVGVLLYFAFLAWSIQRFVGVRVERNAKLVAKSTVIANTALNDLHVGYRELAVAGKRDHYFSIIENSREAAAESMGAQLFYVAMPRYIIETALLLGVLALGGIKLLSGDIAASATTLGVFLTGGMRLMAAMLPWQAALVGMRQCKPQATEAQRYLDTNDTKHFSQTSVPSANVEPVEVICSNISYTYQGGVGPALESISLKVEAGAHVAFIGKSGAGKSTLADVIMGLAKPDSGLVMFNGIEINEISNSHLPCVSYVPQNPGLLSGSIAKNVATGLDDEEIDIRRVNEVIEMVNLAEVVGAFPDGAWTDLGNTRDSLSGGQIQRLGLARALYSNPGLLVLDEATSALDAETESIITRLLRTLHGKTTVITIAHRLHTVEACDRIFLLDQGKLVDEGRFPEVAARNPSVANAMALLKST